MADGLPLLHADEHLLVLDKPPGLLCVPGRGEDKADCLSTRAQAIFPDALVVHRLDMATSGIVVMARGAEVQRRLGMAFEGREVAKRYVALVAGPVALDADTLGWRLIDLPVGADWPRRPRQRVDPLHGKPSRTRLRVLAVDERHADHPGIAATRLELEPVTGRTHQLRVHLQAIGHPILGDPLYGGADEGSRLKLHATSLTLTHPGSGLAMTFESPAPF